MFVFYAHKVHSVERYTSLVVSSSVVRVEKFGLIRDIPKGDCGLFPFPMSKTPIFSECFVGSKKEQYAQKDSLHAKRAKYSNYIISDTIK